MKVREVLRRYAAGERNFRRINLRGQSFKGQDLSGADFSEADIRGANFTNAKLRGVNFTRAKVGLQRRLLIFQLLVSYLLSSASIGVSGFAGLFTFSLAGIGDDEVSKALNTTSNDSGIAILICLLITGVQLAIVIRQGLTFKAFGSVILAFSITVVFTGFLASYFPIVGASGIVGALSGVFITTGFLAGIFATTMAGIGGAAVFVILSVSILRLSYGTFASSIIVAFCSVYVAWRTYRGDEKFALIRTINNAFRALGGTCFYKADLTDANFTNTILRSTNFREAMLIRVCWQNAKQLDLARLGNTYLANSEIRKLVVTFNGQDQNYDGLNLEGVNLQSANLQDASFVGTNLNHANLQDVNLSRAVLKQTQLDGTNLTGATLTGACIEDWGITGTTKLNGMQCDYIFMRVPTKENPVPLRKPDNQREMFAEGGFADFIQPYVDTLDLYHSQDVDPRAISIAFKKLSQNHPNADLEIVAMEKRGKNSLNLKVRTALTADKSELSAEYFADYNQLKALSEVRLLLLTEKDDRIRSLEQMIQTALHQPIFNVETVQGDFMPENSGININVGESIGTISGLVSGDVSGVVNLGTISGAVTNAINQLPETSNPDQPDLKQLLIQLKEAIEADPDLPDTDKADLLEQVQNLAEAKQTEEPAQKEGLARRAKKMFEATLKSLPDTAKIVEASSKLLPLILKALGFAA